MGAGPTSDDRENEEAARWFARLNENSVSTADLSTFWAWRRDPANSAAYARIEQVWRDSSALKDDPDIQAALSQARYRGQDAGAKARRWQGPLMGGVGAGLALIAATAVFVSNRLGGDVYETTVGRQRDIALSDGSHVRLDADSRIRVRYTAKVRRIALERGQADFDVVHLPARPLRVDAASARISDLGTRFEVRRDTAEVQITLLSGSIEVASRSDRTRTLKPGEQIVVGPTVHAVRTIDPVKAASWTQGRLIFEDLPLSTAIDQVNRYAQHPVALASSGAGGVHVSGSFNAGDTEAFVAAVCQLYNLKADRRGDGSIVLRSAGPESGG